MLLSRLAIFGVLLSTLTGIIGIPSQFSEAQTQCGPGERLSTSTDIPKMGQLPPDLRKAGVCWNPNDTDIGASADQAKQYLNSLPNKCVDRCQAPPDKAHIDKLHGPFAICAARFIQEYTKRYGPVGLSSAFRCGPSSPASIQCDRTENDRAGGAPSSNHQTGLAIDVNPKGGNASYETMWEFAKANPQLGVCFPYLGNDRPHMAMAGANTGESAKCAAQGIKQACSGSGFDPNQIQNPGPNSLGSGQIAARSPAQNAMQALGSLFAPPPPQCPQGYIMLNGQCMPPQAQTAMQQPSPFSYGDQGQSPTPVPTGPSGNSGGATSPTSGTSGGSSSGGSNSGTGSSGGTGNTGSGITIGSNVGLGSGGGGTIVSGLIDTSGSPTKNTTTSAIDIINSIANPTTTQSTATGTKIGTSIALNNSLQNTVTLNSAGQNPSTLTPSSTYALNPFASQTFISDDLSKTPVQNFGVTNMSTFAILENIKQILLKILQLLRPFGGVVPNTNVANSTTAYL